MHFSITKSTTELLLQFGMNTRPQNLHQRRWFSITTSISKWLMRFSEFTKPHQPHGFRWCDWKSPPLKWVLWSSIHADLEQLFSCWFYHWKLHFWRGWFNLVKLMQLMQVYLSMFESGWCHLVNSLQKYTTVVEILVNTPST